LPHAAWEPRPCSPYIGFRRQSASAWSVGRREQHVFSFWWVGQGEIDEAWVLRNGRLRGAGRDRRSMGVA